MNWRDIVQSALDVAKKALPVLSAVTGGVPGAVTTAVNIGQAALKLIDDVSAIPNLDDDQVAELEVTRVELEAAVNKHATATAKSLE